MKVSRGACTTECLCSVLLSTGPPDSESRLSKKRSASSACRCWNRAARSAASFAAAAAAAAAAPADAAVRHSMLVQLVEELDDVVLSTYAADVLRRLDRPSDRSSAAEIEKRDDERGISIGGWSMLAAALVPG